MIHCWPQGLLGSEEVWQSGGHWSEHCKLQQCQEGLQPNFIMVGPKTQPVLISPGTACVEDLAHWPAAFSTAEGETSVLKSEKQEGAQISLGSFPKGSVCFECKLSTSTCRCWAAPIVFPFLCDLSPPNHCAVGQALHLLQLPNKAMVWLVLVVLKNLRIPWNQAL